MIFLMNDVKDSNIRSAKGNQKIFDVGCAYHLAHVLKRGRKIFL